MVQDAPLRYDDLSYKTLEEKKVWKPGNYGNDYKGDITLRRALQLSRNVCTIRVLEDLELDVVFEQAEPSLGYWLRYTILLKKAHSHQQKYATETASHQRFLVCNGARSANQNPVRW